MAETKLDIELDPKNFKKSIDDLIEAVKNLSLAIETQLGREAPKAIQKLEESAEKGSGRIGTFFKNLAKSLKDDLKAGLEVGRLASGLNLGNQLISGVKEVFSLEKAFDKLNSRLQLSGKAYQDFKKQIGTSVAATGQKIEDIFPGVELAASKGNIKSTKDLSMIAESLGEIRATTGESTESLADTVIEILKNEGKKVTGENFQKTLNALQATRVSGAFKTAGEAGDAIKGLTSNISPDQLRAMGLGTRELGGLAAMASRGGDQGQDILKHILTTATEAGGKEKLNAVLGAELFNKQGQLQVGNFKNINKQRFGQYSEQALSAATGADQAGLSRFLDSMKNGMGDFAKVTQGSNETANQFAIATNNLASGADKFKEKTKNVGREIGDDLAEAAQDIVGGNYGSALEKAKSAGQTALDNKGIVAGATGTAALAAVLTGGGLGGLLKRVPGKGGELLGGLGGGGAGSLISNASGATPVYVVNAAEIKGGGAIDTASSIAKFGGLAAKAGGLGLAVGGGAYIGNLLANNSSVQKATDPVFKSIVSALGVQKSNLDITKRGAQSLGGLSPDALASAVSRGTEQGMSKANRNKETKYTNPSNITGRGATL